MRGPSTKIRAGRWPKPSLLVASRGRPADFLVRELGSENIHSEVYPPTISGPFDDEFFEDAHEFDRLRIQDGVRTKGDNVLRTSTGL